MKSILYVIALLSAPVFAADTLSDAQLDVVTAGAEEGSAELLKLSAEHQTASGKTVKVDGALDLDRAKTIDVASLSLKDNAQSNLRSLININAVQSNVNVLMNLNIMIDSQVGELKQLNLSAK